MALAFVFQNVVPSITSSLEVRQAFGEKQHGMTTHIQHMLHITVVYDARAQGDVAKIRTSIIVGTSIPLAMFLLWDAAILGSTLLDTIGAGAGTSVDPVAAVRAADPVAAPLIDAFTLVAIATSYIGFVVALTDVFADALQVRTTDIIDNLVSTTCTQPSCLWVPANPFHMR